MSKAEAGFYDDDAVADQPTMGTDVDHLTAQLWRYFSPLIFIFGCFGNLMILIVLRRSPSSGKTTNILVQLIALADLLVLIICLTSEIMYAYDVIDVREAHPVSCKVFKFFQYSMMDIAVWFMTAFAVERFIYVCFPFRGREFCSVPHIKLSSMLLIVLAIGKNVHTFWTRGAEWMPADNDHEMLPIYVNGGYRNHTDVVNSFQYNYTLTSEVNDRSTSPSMVLVSNCGYTSRDNAKFHLYVRPWIVFLCSNLLPLLTLIATNGAVVWTLSRRRRHWGEGSTLSGESSAAHHVTVMCLTMSIAFVIFIVPTMILLVGKPYWKATEESAYRYAIAKAINNQLYFVNHSINFYLYLLTVRSFRVESVKVLCWCCRRLGRKYEESEESMYLRKLNPQPCKTSTLYHRNY